MHPTNLRYFQGRHEGEIRYITGNTKPNTLRTPRASTPSISSSSIEITEKDSIDTQLDCTPVLLNIKMVFSVLKTEDGVTVDILGIKPKEG